MPRLLAEEELIARAAASHPHLDGKTQQKQITRLMKTAGIEEPIQKPTRADLSAIGIQVVGD